MTETALLTLMLVEGISSFGFQLSHGATRTSNFSHSDTFIGSKSQKLYDDLTLRLLHEKSIPNTEHVGRISLDEMNGLTVLYSPFNWSRLTFTDHLAVGLPMANKKSHSEETKRKISESLRGRVRSDEVRERIAESIRGMKRSEKTKEKIRKARTGKRHSEETKRKIAESTRKRHENRKKSNEHWTEDTNIGVFLFEFNYTDDVSSVTPTKNPVTDGLLQTDD